MISKRMVNHHAKSECSAYRGAAILRTSLLTDKNVKPAPFTKNEKSAAHGKVKRGQLDSLSMAA
jgi:hypothetical protein